MAPIENFTAPLPASCEWGSNDRRPPSSSFLRQDYDPSEIHTKIAP